ncbi:SRPBCC domain-containing protein [Paenibacillus chartarius]|uniref:SRPBCC domain-containing protein n=1 Tax=Paenibacillus chartarius TaxID=747481 RepID=A0ABV6DR07_9BACL
MSNDWAAGTSKAVGQTASAGFQIGVRRTLPMTEEQAWSFLTSAEGLKLWLGEVSGFALQAGESFVSEEGISGEFRVVKPKQQLRLRWKPSGWAAPSTLQIRLLPASSGRTTISFHQEQLDGPETRERMKLHWEHVLDEIRRYTGE